MPAGMAEMMAKMKGVARPGGVFLFVSQKKSRRTEPILLCISHAIRHPKTQTRHPGDMLVDVVFLCLIVLVLPLSPWPLLHEKG